MSQRFGGRKSGIIRDSDDFVEYVDVQRFRDETRADALNLVRARFAACQNRGSSRFDGDDLNGRVLFFQIFSNAGQRATSADACDENIDFAVRVAPDFRAGGRLVDGRVGRIGELQWHEAARNGGGQFLRFFDRAFHAFGAFGQHEVCAIAADQFLAFDAHGFRHGNDDAVTACGTDSSQCNAGVAGGRFDDGGTGDQFAVGFSGIDHGFGNTVFGAPCRIEVLQFGKNCSVGIDVFAEAGDFQKRGIADQIGRAFCNIGHDDSFK